jgi:hypothetical protein
MAKEIAVVEAGHGDFRDTHFEESGEGGEDTILLFVKTETGCSRKIATFHDTGGNKDLRVLLVNDFETGGTL